MDNVQTSLTNHIPTSNVKIDVQSLLQTFALICALIAYAFKQNDRLTTLEVKQQISENTLHEVGITQQTMVRLFNEHLVDVASKGEEAKDFQDLVERLLLLEKKDEQLNNNRR